jgi:C4-dicarboxylate transporter DctQ subunit
MPVPFFMLWLADVFNDGEAYEKLPKVVPYLVLPISMALLTFRFAQAAVRIWRGEQESLIVSHEAEDEVAEAAARLKEQN